RVRGARGRALPSRRPGLPHYGRAGGSADDPVRPALCGGVRDPGVAAAHVVLASTTAAPCRGAGAGMSRTVWRWGRIAGSAVTFTVLVWRLGAGPFLDGIRVVDIRALVAAAALAVLTTVCCAWRWRIVARGLG